MSKNWSLRNYIESRLYMFKFVYDFGKGYTQTSNSSSNCRNSTNNKPSSSCYPSTVFDFSPYTFALRLPQQTNNNKGRLIHVTQHITVDNDSGALGFTPHTSLTTFPYTPVKNTQTSQVVFKSLVKAVIGGKSFGSNQKSVLNMNYNLGNRGTGINTQDKYIDTFINFLKKYDRIKFAGEDGLLSNSNSEKLQVVTLTDGVIRTMFYDLIHDEVVNKTDSFEEFRDKFIQEFNSPDFGLKPPSGGGSNSVGRPGIVTYSKLIGKTIAAKSYKAYKSILTPPKANNGSMIFMTHNVKGKNGVVKKAKIPQYPALFKTIGDLSQFMYAAKFNTIVGSGDKMGIATGMYVNALNSKIVKCMIEDAVTGFIIYTGMNPEHVKFITKSGCGRLANKANACYGRNGAIVTPAQIQTQMINSLNANEKTFVNGIRNRQRTYLKRLETTAPGLAQPIEKPVTRGNNKRTKRAAARSGTTSTPGVKRPKFTPVSAANGNAMNVNNATRRRSNLNAYINNLQRQLSKRGKLNKLNKPRYLSELNQKTQMML